ncbi:MAG TPA: hypothetical protein VNP90_09435 [Actinomycetota bacterium]|nr:hypothetical protein [Actinomycetota bacterium]
MRPIPSASRAHGDSTVRTEVFDGFLFFEVAFFFEGRERDPLLPDLREGEVFVAMFRQA